MRPSLAVAAIAVVAVVLAAALPGARTASAHAAIVRSEPAAGAELAAPPSTLAIWFSEAIEPAFSRVELFTRDGTRIEPRETAVEAATSDRLTAALPPLAPGVYTVVARMLSRVDGHASVASFTFSVLGAGGTEAGATAFAPDLAGDVSAAGVAGRWLTLVALALIVGGGAAALAVSLAARPAHEARTARPARRPRPDLRGGALALYARWALAAAVVAAAGEALLLLAQHGEVGGSLRELLLDTRFGTHLLWREATFVVAFAAAALVVDRHRPADRRGERLRGQRALVAALLLGGVGASYSLSAVSHAAAAPGRFWAQSTDLVHLVSAELWLGGAAFLAVLLLRLGANGKGGVDAGIVLRLVSWFSQAAAFTVLLLAATGLVRALGELPARAALIETSYGRWLLVKLALITPLLALGLLNRRVVAALASEAIEEAAALRRLRALLPAEALLGAVVLLSVAALGQAPTPGGAPLDGSSLASPAPQLSAQALQGGALALAAAAVVAGVAIAAPARARSRRLLTGTGGAFAAGLVLAVVGGLQEAAATTAPSGLAAAAPAPAADCSRIEAGANLAGCDLGGRDLGFVDLRGANLSGENLDGANLFGARLQDATLLDATLRGADLTASYLQNALLRGADLRAAQQRGANAGRAVLDGADLAGANLTGLDRAGASLVGANLDGALLSGTDLNNANLSGVNWANTACPEGPEAIPGGVQLCASTP